NSTAANLVSGNGQSGVEITGAGTSGNLVAGNLIGTDVNGTQALANIADGVIADGGASANTIGGTNPAARNLISGKGRTGVEPNGAGASANLVVGNFIGTDVNATAALANGRDGVLIQDAAGNTVGGSAAAARNVISGNGNIQTGGNGVHLTGSG